MNVGPDVSSEYKCIFLLSPLSLQVTLQAVSVLTHLNALNDLIALSGDALNYMCPLITSVNKVEVVALQARRSGNHY
jgi:hypothetical protein